MPFAKDTPPPTLVLRSSSACVSVRQARRPLARSKAATVPSLSMVTTRPGTTMGWAVILAR